MASEWKNVRKNWQIYWKQIKAIKSKQNFNKPHLKSYIMVLAMGPHKNSYILCMWLFSSSVVWMLLLGFRLAKHLNRCVRSLYGSNMEGSSVVETIIFIYIHSKKAIMAIHWISHICDKCSVYFYGLFGSYAQSQFCWKL